MGPQLNLMPSMIREKPAPFSIRGNADRVDEICLSPEMRTAAVDKGLLSATPHTTPLDVRHPNQSGGARRFVVIRDLKTVNGPKVKESGKRHLKALFNEVQLGLYARAWELAQSRGPGGRRWCWRGWRINHALCRIRSGNRTVPCGVAPW